MNKLQQARITDHKSLHDKISIASARRHVYETNQGKNKFIACKDQLQQPWQNWITRKQFARKHFVAKVEHKNDILDYSIIANRGINGQRITICSNILTEVSQNMHGSLCSIMFTWHQNNSRTGTKISNIMKPSLHACASHHIDHKNTW